MFSYQPKQIDTEKENLIYSVDQVEEKPPEVVAAEAEQAQQEPDPDPEPEPEPEQPAAEEDLTYSDNTTIAAFQKTEERLSKVPVVRELLAVGQGVRDTAFDAVGIIPYLKPVDDWYDQHFGRDRETNPLNKFIRDASAVVIPSLVGGGAVLKGASLLPKVGALSGRAAAFGRIAADIGVGTGVAAISEQTQEPGNTADLLYSVSGGNIDVPWRTAHLDDPNKIFALNMIDEVGSAGTFGLVIEGLAATVGKTIYKAKNVEGEALVAAKTADDAAELAAADGDEVVAAVQGRKYVQEALEHSEMVDALAKDPVGEEGFNPLINNSTPEQRAVSGADQVDPLKYKSATTQQKYLGAHEDGVPVAFSQGTANAIYKADDVSEHNKLLQSQVPAIKAQVDIELPSGPKFPSSQVEEALDAKVAEMSGLDFTEQDTWIGKLNKLRRSTVQLASGTTMQAMGKKDLATLGRKVNDYLETFTDTDKYRVRKHIQNQNLSGMTAASRAALALEDSDSHRQLSNFLTKYFVPYYTESRLQARMSGIMLNDQKRLNELIKVKGSRAEKQAAIQAISEESVSDYAETLKKSRVDAETLATDFLELDRTNPYMSKVLLTHVMKSNGQVGSMDALMKTVQNRMGVLKKAFRDTDPGEFSYVLRELDSARYNFMLLGMAPLRAMTGAFMGLVGKPMTIMAGARLKGDTETFKRAMYMFGGIQENLSRARKAFYQEYKFARDNPRARRDYLEKPDMRSSEMADYDLLEDMIPEWQATGQKGKLALWGLTKGLARINDNSFNKLGINAMRGIDGFVQSMTTSMSARARVYDDVFSKNNGALTDALRADMDDEVRGLYNKAFKPDGTLTDEFADAARSAQEINLNADSGVISSLENMMRNYPLMKSIFMFPRTGYNAIELTSTFNPLSPIGVTSKKARAVFNAKTDAEKIAALEMHGHSAKNLSNFDALKSEYTGRWAIGSSLVAGVAMMAANGMVTGSGSYNAAENSRMRKIGFPEFSFYNPYTKQWHSYRGLEPFDSIISLTADIVFNANRVDEPFTESFFRKVAAAISLNLTDKTFLSGLEPLSDLITMDPRGLEKFAARQVNSSLIPYSGIRSILNKMVAPGIKEIKGDFVSQLDRLNRFIPAVGARLEDRLDVYTGEPIKYWDPQTNFFNSISPLFTTNGGMEPWRIKLLESGWDELRNLRVNPYTQQPISPKEATFINNHMGEKQKLGEQVEAFFNQNSKDIDSAIKKFAKVRGLTPSKDLDISKLWVHSRLNEIHNNAFKTAFRAYISQNENAGAIMNLTRNRDALLESNPAGAAQLQQQIDKLVNMSK